MRTHVAAPKQINPKSLADYLEVISKAAFQAGISWQVVESKWPGIKESFDNFDPAVIAKYTGTKMADLLEDDRVIRNHLKLEAVVFNARRMLELDKQYKGFKKYLRSFGSYEELVKDLRKNFKFLGEMGAYYFLYVVGEKVP
ncbi:MAG: DNA-3-methyladenine glycosylase I, partial [Dehalococcoidales bacterium]